MYSVEDKYFQNRLCNSGMRHILGRETSRFSTRNKSTNLLTSRDIVEWAFRNALWAVKGLPAEPPIKPPFLRAFEGLLYRDYVSTQTLTPVIVLLSQR